MRKLFIIKMKKLKDGNVSGKEEINKVRISDLYDIKNKRCNIIIFQISHYSIHKQHINYL